MQPAKIVQQGILALLIGLAGNPAVAEVVVVVSAKSRIIGLQVEQVANIFLGKTQAYPNGDPAVPLDQSESAAVRQEFYARVAHKSPALLKAHWSKLLFTGRGQPPREVTNSQALKQAIAENPMFIGYLDKSDIDDSVRVVLAP